MAGNPVKSSSLSRAERRSSALAKIRAKASVSDLSTKGFHANIPSTNGTETSLFPIQFDPSFLRISV